ncbi:MAG: NfeD family protein [Gammaproteobacteria bacterium]|nr:NfeD family protein [Gammaproteobacteria bacterium]
MIEYINNNLAGFWIFLGFGLLIAEVLVFGFGTIVLLFAGIGAIITGLLIMAGLLPPGWIASIASFGIATGISGVLLWKPFKKLQSRTAADQKPQSDFVGLKFRLDKPVSTSAPGSYRYSGVDWKVMIDPGSDLESIETGTEVEVISLDVGVLRVKPVNE